MSVYVCVCTLGQHWSVSYVCARFDLLRARVTAEKDSVVFRIASVTRES